MPGSIQYPAVNGAVFGIIMYCRCGGISLALGHVNLEEDLT